MNNHEKSFGILLANGDKIKHSSVVLGKTLEIDGLFISGKIVIPFGR